jgi:hypothetical protein
MRLGPRHTGLQFDLYQGLPLELLPAPFHDALLDHTASLTQLDLDLLILKNKPYLIVIDVSNAVVVERKRVVVFPAATHSHRRVAVAVDEKRRCRGQPHTVTR